MIERANKVVHEYSSRRLTQAVKKVEKERKGEGCGCLHCAHDSVKVVNSWVDWVGYNCDQNYLDSVKYKVKFKRSGTWKIKQGE